MTYCCHGAVLNKQYRGVPYNGSARIKVVPFSGFGYIKVMEISQMEIYEEVGKSVI